jgi:cytochrome c
MFNSNWLCAIVLAGAALTASAQTAKNPPFAGIGRPATPAEIKAWDIDVRPDFKGLPNGRGTVAKGQDVWESKCAACHGVFGESNQVFTPIIGGTTKKDIQSGRTAALANDSQPQRTTMMKLSSVSTLWDYINRAMPWNAPKTLTVEEVYAVTGYILNLAEVVPDDFTLSNENIAEVQKKIPNRDGKTTQHGFWLPSGKPDVKAVACMSNCSQEVKVTSALPEHARESHGNLAEQSRLIGAARGQVTMAPKVAAATSAKPSEFAAVKELTAKATCLACHGLDRKVVGPGFNDIAAKYKTNDKAESYLAGKIRSGGQGVWGSVPMPPPAGISDADATLLARWILKGTPE